jgi:ATP-dependent Clp protease ATP-binding subunit ClpA
MRAATGLTGAQSSPYGTRPRGTLFFAGPTGVGKTELAKQLTRVVFGDERAYIRFDMSEFSAEHAADRLIGAPPGYVGFAAGGELTNAIRERPFSVVLFDEIEKAHPRILDKFLQVLEDGRLTDGRGATVYFTEAVLVFTSNLGMWISDGAGGRVPNVTRDSPRDGSERERLIREAIQRHFTEELGRPELLNRFGDGIVVFDFIGEETAISILDLLVANVATRMQREHGTALELAPPAREQLIAFAVANLDNGGRGIATVVENALVNPLARRMFAGGPRGATLTVLEVVNDGRTYDVVLAP